ncbi:phospholipase D-like domain-containing protein [Microvirga ossetica]|uniref:phospholipase D-like domain-containing protein n=1 Tax=Microvirga ossetica TaxID=1882682 RepID=UPI003001C4A5
MFVLSTFIAAQADEKGREQRDRILDALDRAIKRGVRCHLFFGTSLDEHAKHAHAMEEIRVRLSAGGLTRGYLQVHRDPVRSHAKILAADDGRGGAVVVIGSCNWLSSPFSAVEVSVVLRASGAAAAASTSCARFWRLSRMPVDPGRTCASWRPSCAVPRKTPDFAERRPPALRRRVFPSFTPPITSRCSGRRLTMPRDASSAARTGSALRWSRPCSCRRKWRAVV